MSIGYWWEENWPYVVITALVAPLAVAIIAAARHTSIERQAFMAECKQHRENYECVAMWRAGDSHVDVVPFVIPVR